MPRIDAVTISDDVLDKIERKHSVTFDEAEEACYASPPAMQRRRGRDNSLLIFSRTDSGRYLLVVLSYLGENV